MTPTREVYFNIRHVWVMYVLFALTLVVFAVGFYRRWRLWQIGAPANRLDHPRERLAGLFRQTGLHEKLLKRYRGAGLYHFAFLWGFFILLLGTFVVFLQEDLHIPIMHGWFYLIFQSLTLNIFGLLFIVAIAAAIVNRYVLRPTRLKPDKADDAIILVLLLTILVTGFLIQGARIQLTHDPWAAWSPVGNVIGQALASAFDTPQLFALHRFLWWCHLLIVFGFIGWIPYSKLLHIATSPANIYLRNLEPRGKLPSIDFETTETLGVSKLEQFTWKDLLDLDACTECGRCEVNCPATLTDKPLSPKRLILDLRENLHKLDPFHLPLSSNGANHGAGGNAPSENDAASPLVGPVIKEEALWSCTTCSACMEQCPVMIEQVPKIVQMRQHLVMEQAEFPDDLQAMIRSLEARSHPYPGNSASRVDWMSGLEVPVLGEADTQYEVLLWVGCAGALNERNRSVTRALAELLLRAGVKFAVLGRQEKCTGDPAKRIGHEMLFQQLALQNIATLDGFGVRKVLTACPHCFNTLRNEYPQLGGTYEVMHHTEFLQQLIAEGRLQPRAGSLENVTFHDPCYLGRYNQVYDAPRETITAIPGASLVEVENWNRRNALCCGGGGGFAFMEEKSGTRMNANRSRQLLATGASTVAVACPFCMMMVDDGVKTLAIATQTVQVLDVAELLNRSTS
jgi:Fe-S oxidoreductase/nitrate reductase gamma subunit